eukprot:TRINITY_DN67517_c3_g1_i1.p1 TRINITY_DN67517_c3_g1~~TRINITY_DN67517_c3_g1_i1.p1  ORF type:complete len:464 (+),score=57.47 TRINITY_DN67517_c3_g1_i1:107-1393(+)
MFIKCSKKGPKGACGSSLNARLSFYPIITATSTTDANQPNETSVVVVSVGAPISTVYAIQLQQSNPNNTNTTGGGGAKGGKIMWSCGVMGMSRLDDWTVDKRHRGPSVAVWEHIEHLMAINQTHFTLYNHQRHPISDQQQQDHTNKDNSFVLAKTELVHFKVMQVAPQQYHCVIIKRLVVSEREPEKIAKKPKRAAQYSGSGQQLPWYQWLTHCGMCRATKQYNQNGDVLWQYNDEPLRSAQEKLADPPAKLPPQALQRAKATHNRHTKLKSQEAVRYWEKPVLGNCQMLSQHIQCEVWQQFHLPYTTHGTVAVFTPNMGAWEQLIVTLPTNNTLLHLPWSWQWLNEQRTVGLHTVDVQRVGDASGQPVQFDFPAHWQPALVEFGIPKASTVLFVQFCNSWHRCIQVLFELVETKVTVARPPQPSEAG